MEAREYFSDEGLPWTDDGMEVGEPIHEGGAHGEPMPFDLSGLRSSERFDGGARNRPGLVEESEEVWAEFNRLCRAESPDLLANHPDYYGFVTYSMFSGVVAG